MPDVARTVNYSRPKDIVFNIPQADIGKVIGKGGSRIRELQQVSGARITIRDGLVTLRGNPDDCLEAQRLIRRIVGGDGIRLIRDLDDQSLALLADPSLGEFIDSVCDEFDGDVEVSQKEVMIEAFDQSDETAAKMENALRAKLTTLSRSVEVRIGVEDASCLRQIFEDQYLLILKDQKGLQIRTDRDDSGSGINLSGPAAVVAEAETILNSLLLRGEAATLLPLTTNFLKDLDMRAQADFQRDVKHHVENKYGVTVSYEWYGNRLQVFGDNAIPALRVAAEVIIYYKPSQAGIFFIRPPQAAQHVCGRDDMHLTRLQSPDCVVVWNAHNCSVWVCGTERAVNVAMDRLSNLQEEWLQTHKVIEVREPRRLGRVIGPGGQNLRDIQDESRTIVTTSEEGYILIKGDTTQALETAAGLINQALNSADFSPSQPRQQSRYAPGQFSPTPRGRGRGRMGRM